MLQDVDVAALGGPGRSPPGAPRGEPWSHELRQDTPGPAGREADAARAAWLAAVVGSSPDAIIGKTLAGIITSFATVARDITEQVRAAAANTLRSVIARAAAL
jgi:hypothetical protein